MTQEIKPNDQLVKEKKKASTKKGVFLPGSTKEKLKQDKVLATDPEMGDEELDYRNSK